MAISFPGFRNSQIGGDVAPMAAASQIGVEAGDLQRLRIVLAVTEGAQIEAGALLFHDRKRPWIRAVAPLAGRITRLEPGPRRGLTALEITPEIMTEIGPQARARSFALAGAGQGEGLAALMIEAGLWSALRTRPFGRVPDPASRPDALFVTLTAGLPGAPAPIAALRGAEEAFRRGLAALPSLGGGPVFLCHPPGYAAPDLPGLRPVAFAGGLPSDHIHALRPVADGGMVWQIGWQEVVALGHLLETGRIWPWRIVALSGAAVARPGLIRVPLGARLHDIAAARLKPGPLRLACAPGAGSSQPFLRPGAERVLAEPLSPARPAGWLRHLARPARPALIPTLWQERRTPRHLLAVPLLRALEAGDAARAGELGALGLIEEDLEGLARGAGSPDYPALLRQSLIALEAMA